ncbi:site-specific integrase [Methylobacterium sp. OT2]|uniref:tyrosine-type recombinase/integrase n=1 Tax=Methylobacterium sp. OT2 TaxID=2813779 RepID=UPI00197C1C3B|nr:site-specific integrase [Methylobacterium sp. OT2]MBN4097037.1 site-specific integrase [Methylobacterium sp. OT2]
MRLTKATIGALEISPGKTERIVFDDALPGFGIRLRAGGKRTWIVQYRVGTKHRRVTLANAAALDPEEARKRAREILAKVQLGGDPQTEKVQARARAAITLSGVTADYLQLVETRLRPTSYAEAERYLRRYLAPLHDAPVHSVGRREVASWLNGVAAQHGPHAANRGRTCLSALFTWAMRQGIVETNPVTATGKAVEETSRTRVLTAGEISEIWRACRDDDHGRIVKLLLLTGQRRNEVGGMRWCEIDKESEVWRLPAERTKNGLPHDVPLSGAVREILETVPRRAGREFLFGESAGSYQGWSRAKTSLDKRINETRIWMHGRNTQGISPWRIHDLRRTVVTHMNENLGVLPHVVEAVVNHITGPARMGVAGVYNRATYATEKTAALENWSEYIRQIITADI